MFERLLLVGLLTLAPMTPAMASEDDPEDLAPPAGMAMPTDVEQFKGLSAAPSGLGTADMASVMRLVKIGQALKARQKVAPEDIQFLRAFLQKSGLGTGDGSQAGMAQKLDDVLGRLQQSTSNPTEADDLMRDMADGADMDDLPKLDD